MRQLLVILFFFVVGNSFSQSGGTDAYQILNTSFSARLAVLNQPTSVYDSDINMGIFNPSLLNDQMYQQLALNIVDYYSDIKFASAGYVIPVKEFGHLSLSFSSIDYGDFTLTDNIATDLGVFSSTEQLISVGFGKQIFKNISIGMNLKTLFSNLESYSSIAFGSDLSLVYFNPESSLSFSVLARNIGTQITSYTDQKETLPYQVDLGISKKLDHLPFRFIVGYKNFQEFDLTYQNEFSTTLENVDGTVLNADDNFGSKLFKHFDLGGELTLGKRLALRFGYNAQRRSELKLTSNARLVGFSWGLGLKISHFYLNYGRSTYHLYGSPNYFSITTDISKFYTRK